MPALSIIIPLHNKGPYIRDTLESAQAQDFTDWEALVVENHSTDDGPSQVLEIAARDPRIRLADAPPEIRGPGAARNLGLSVAGGEWVLFLDADDLLESHQFASLINASRSREVQIVAGGWKEFSSCVNSVCSVRIPDTQSITNAIVKTPWAVHAAIVRRAWLTGDKRWLTEMDALMLEDLAFWFRATFEARVAFVQSTGALYRFGVQGNRNLYSDFSAWVKGFDVAVQNNVEYMRQRGRRLDAYQVDLIMRYYESAVLRCMVQGNGPILRHLYSTYRTWVRKAVCRNPFKFPICARLCLPWYFLSHRRACLRMAEE
jgi:glycosyltransferase involved in cell wall biosynthesis